MGSTSANNSEQIKIWVVIVTFNGVNWIKKCLDSLTKSTVNLSIVIVDNNSTDETIQIIKKEFTNITLLPQSQNLGFGASNNIGISHALNQNAEYIFLLNQDAYIETDTIDRLLRVSISNPDFGILSPIQLNGKGDKLDHPFMQYLEKNEFLYYDAIKSNYRFALYELPFVNAAAWFIPRRVFLDIGGFDPIFFHYGEDTNFCQRIIFHNYKIGVYPHAFILHDREYRQLRAIIPYSNEYYENHKKDLKVKYANINIFYPNDILYIEKKSLLKSSINNLFRLNINEFLSRLKKHQYIDPLFKLIYKSRDTTRLKGSHFLTLD